LATSICFYNVGIYANYFTRLFYNTIFS